MQTLRSERLSTTNAAALSFRQLLAEDIEDLLLPFYLSLDFDARRSRFDGGVSDDSIARHCRGLDEAVVLGCLSQTGLTAAIELHPLSSHWDFVELAFASSATTERITILGHLLQLAAFVCGKRGCTALVIPMQFPDRDMPGLLRGMGRVRFQSDQALVDLREYARPHRPSALRS